jgi:hypothetical protein
MKKQTLLALTAGLAIIASGISFANTQSNSFRSNPNGDVVISGSSDQTTGQQDQSVTNQDQNTGTTGTFKKKIAEKTFGSENGNTSSTDSNNSSSSTQSSDTNSTTTNQNS